MIQQQRFGASMVATCAEVVRRHGLFGGGLYRGLGLAMLRDSIYVGGMLGATPLVHRRLAQGIPAVVSDPVGDPSVGGDGATADGWRDAPPGHATPSTASFGSTADAALISLAASMIGGVVGALLSHPLDVAKTCMQGDLPRTQYAGSIASLRRLVRDGGLPRLYHGATWRTINITATVWIANECSLRLPPYFRPAREKPRLL